MKNTFEHVKLLDAALVDESWESCSARLRNEGLASLRARRRIRARCLNGGQIAALLVFGLEVTLREVGKPAVATD